MNYNIRLHTAFPNLKVSSKEQLFAAMTAQLSKQTAYPQNLLIEGLMLREFQSPSGIEEGLAMPHLKVRGLPDRYIALATLNTPLDFGAPDKKPADLICLLLSPEKHGGLHLRGLSRLTRLLKNRELCQKLREAKDADTIHAVFLNPDGWLLAA